MMKIRKFIFHYAGEGRDSLTEDELAFTTSCRDSLQGLYQETVLGDLPEGTWEQQTAVPRPDLSQGVIVKVEEGRAEPLQIPEGREKQRDETVPLVAGNQHLVQFSLVKDLLEEGVLTLI